MGTLSALDGEIVLWFNQVIGRSGFTNGIVSVLISDYFIPLSMCFWMLGLWFCGNGPEHRSRHQKAVLTAAISLGFANLAVLLLNQEIFRDRPFVHHELTAIFYEPTDSSFPSNPAAIAFAVTTAIWWANRRAALPLLCMAISWCLARVAGGLFYPSDIVAGGLIGTAVACLITFGMGRIEPAPTWVLKGARLLHLA